MAYPQCTTTPGKLNPTLVAEARLLAAYGVPDGELAQRYGVTGVAVWFAVTGVHYKNVSTPPVLGRRHHNPRRKLEPWQAAQIYYDFWHGNRMGFKLSRRHNVPPYVVYRIAYGEAYRDVTSKVNLDA